MYSNYTYILYYIILYPPSIRNNPYGKKKLYPTRYTRDHGKGKGKAVPLQAWSGPEGSRKLRLPDFLTTAQDGGKVVSLTHRPTLPQEILLVLISVKD